MSSGLGELTTQAHQLVAAGDLAGAQELLADALAAADPSPASASPELADAASLQARVLITLGEPHSARAWAAFAYSAATRLYGPADQRTVAAAATLAAVLHRVGSHARAARLYQDVIIELTATDGPESLRVLAAHADLATVEYAQGRCDVARERLQDAWELHREVYGDGSAGGIKMLARLGAMQRDCGHFTEAHDNLALARELCRGHLPADHPLTAQVASLARAGADPGHVCAADLPARPAPATPPPTANDLSPTATATAPPSTRIPSPRTSDDREAIDPAGGPGVRLDSDEHSGEPGHRSPPADAAAAPWRSPAPTPPPPPTEDQAGTAGEAEADGSDGGPVESVSDIPVDGWGTARLQRLPERRQPVPLPVTIHRAPPHRPPNRTLPLVLAGLLVVLLGAAAVIAGFALVESDPPPPPGPTPGGTVSPTTAPG